MCEKCMHEVPCKIAAVGHHGNIIAAVGRHAHSDIVAELGCHAN